METTYKILPTEEWERLREIYPEDHPLPSPQVASVVVAERDGKLVGCLFMQLSLHMEPLILATPDVNWLKMKKIFDEALPPESHYFICAPDEKIEKMCQIAGLQDLGWKLYEGIAGGE